MTKIKIFLTCIGFSIFTSFSLFAQTPLEDAQAYLKANSLKFGLNGDDISDIEVSASHVSSASGIKHIYYTQKFKGVSVYGTYSSQHYNSKGEFIHINNAFIPNLERGITNKIPAPQLSSIEAIEKVASALSLSIKSPLQIISNIGNEEQKAVISDGGISLENIPVKLVYFPRANSLFTTNSKETKSPYVIDLAWEMYIYEANQNNYWYLIVDAFSGNILYKNNLVVSCGFDEANHAHHDHPQLNEESSETSRAFNVNVAGSSMMVGGYRVYPMPIESPGHGARSLINNPDNALASPFGWHDTNGAAGPEFTITRGNNTHAYEDGNNPGFSPDGFAPLVFDFPINTTYMVGVDESEPAIITNLFYWTNIVHDVTYQYGFTEAAGNFQVNNYGRGGLGNDDCRAEAQDGSGTCNANFGTPPDGSRPTMQMYICGTRDGDIDNGVILHEYAHGISNRLTGGPSNVNCLNNAEQMGEGWSDWYAIVMTIEPGDMGPDRRPIGTWLFGQPPTGAGIRAFPYSTSLAIDPRTYNTIKTSAIPHGVGSVWCAMLWEVTWELINTYGYDANFYTGNGGNNRALRLITEAMKLQPCSPGFVDGRDAILLADRNIYNGANQCAIWRAFAKRGLGLSATQGSTNSVTDGTEAFDVPVACQAAPPTMVCFDYTGGMQTWVVPAGITSITIDAYGAAGATALNSVNFCGGSPDRGGLGGYAKGTLTVTPGETLNIFVGGAGQNSGAGAFNGGGAPCADPNTCSGGGGASDVRQGGSALANRRIVAGGGGGAEFSCGGQGGGAGGGLTGADALGGDCNPSGNDGKGGTQAAGGNGGAGNCGSPVLPGGNGSLGLGGNATQGAGSWHSAGGGGGYYGGGGGATDGSAGGGSSYIGGVTSASTTPGLRTGHGNICISYAAAPLTITCPAPVTVGCATSVPAPDITAPVVSGGCPPLVVTHRGDAITNQTCANRYTVTRTYRVTDACQATAECTQIITVNDITHPSIICPAAASVACASLVPAPDVNLVIAADLCGNVGIIKEFVSDVITNQTCANRYTITRTYRATDVCGNSGTCTQIITVNDNVVPIALCKNLTVSLDAKGEYRIKSKDLDNGSSDNCGIGGLRFEASDSVFTCPEIGVNNVILRVFDACGNSASCTSTVTVRDTIPPTLVCPGVAGKDNDIHLKPGECGAFINFVEPYATDNCELTLTSGVLTTLFQQNNGQSGNMFDLTNLTVNPITINSFDVNIPTGAAVIAIYYTTTATTYVGNTNTPAQWTLLGTANVNGLGIDQMTPVPIGGLTLAGNQAKGIYVTTTNGVIMRYTNIPPALNIYQNTDLRINGGIGKAYNATFTGANNLNRMWNGVVRYSKFTGAPPVVTQTDNTGLHNGSFFPRGKTCLSYKATDNAGNTATCEFCFNVIEFANPIKELACNDEVQISLDQNCEATIGADMILEGGPYGCYDDYIVQVRYWTGGGLVDRNLLKAGTQINGQDIGKELKITIIDPETGNSCWGHATVEDKLAPLLTCPRDTCLPCSSPTTPSITGVPTVIENCGGASVSYRDNETQGGCAAGYELIIVRTWTAVDASGNQSTCVQKIMVSLGTLATVSVPRNYDNIEEPALNCNEKIDPNKNVGPHMSDFPECVDGYLLDSAYWLANPNQPNIYPNRRIPRVLGWNCIDNPNSPNYGHPSPDVVYYPAHRQWSQTNPLCWGPDTRVMWHGTGRPSGSNCSNLAITFQDIIFDLATPNCNAGPIGCYKVLRQWTVLDWCTSEVGGHNQIIKVIDQEGPQVLYPDSTRINMETWTCTGRWDVPKPWLLDNCSEELHYSVEVENGTVLGDEIAGFVVIDLPEGIQNGYIIAVDCCGNITKKRVVLNVLDRTPPQAVCRTRTVVSLNGNQEPGTNYARLYAKDLNEGSFDNCQPHVWYKVIRMAELLGTNSGSNSNNVVACTGLNGDDNVVLAGNQVYFDDFTQFCCADVGQKIMVVLRVFDVDPGAGPLTPVSMTNPNSALFGRFSDCMVEVEVQDKSVPTVVAPPNMVVSCWYWFDINKATDPNDPTFGRVVTSLSNRAKVKTSDIVCHKFCERNQYTGYPGYVQTNQLPIPAPNLACNYYNQLFDTAHWDRKYELVWGFDGYAINACGTSATIVVNDLRECGQGQIQRIITATGPNNSRVNAIQTIWVVDCDPFFIDPLNCNDPRYSDIQWPNGVCNQNPIVIDGCGADISPENPQLGKPIVVNNADDNCSLISIEKFDEIFTIEPDACFKVLRKWVVIDWCQYDPFIDANFGRWEALQVIKVRDQDKPVVTCEVGPCEPAVIDPTLKVCVGHISLTASATDNCTPIDWLFWEYKIDAYNDGKGIHGGWDYRVGTLTQRQYNAGDTVEYSHNPFADDRHNPFNASGTYPIGIHKIRWNVEDGCGNTGVCETLFEIKDCKAPTPYCLTGVITVPMPSSGCVDIWAKDLDHGSYDNCTPKDKLKIYFDGDANKPSLTICCDDFVNAKVNDELIINVEMWVEDEEGNKDYCKTIIVVQDNDSICLNVGSFAKITGNIMTEGNEEARPVNVQLERNARMMREMTGSPYSFGNLVVNDEYTIKPTRNDDHLNGVSTADIVKIQKHILGQTVITSPYKLIAADVNASGSITASDISEIRKLILGVSPSFAKVQSWTFVPSSYTFFDPTKPWTAPRSSIVIPTSPIEYKENFMAIKMGDVNGNAKAGLVGTAIRTTGTLNFVIEEGSVVEGQTYRMNVKSSDFANIAGYQFTMKYDNESLVYEGVERGSLNINESNIGTIRSGVITTSWNSNVGESYKSNEVLYSIVFKATRSGNISKMISITSDVTRAEAYDNLDQVKEVKLGVRTDKGIVETGVFELYQNEPNPFSKESVISYRLPEASAVKLTVYDVTGKVVRVYELAGQKGLNTYKITKSELNTSGVLYYQLDAADHTATKRMVVID